MRLWTKGGHDWSARYPLITEAALRNRNGSFVIDAEAVLLGVDGRSDFNGLHSRKHDHEVEFFAFDIRQRQQHRKTNLARLLTRRVDGIFQSDFEQGEIGPDLFRHACCLGWRDWSRSTAIAFIAATGRIDGSRSRTGSVRRSVG